MPPLDDPDAGRTPPRSGAPALNLPGCIVLLLGTMLVVTLLQQLLPPRLGEALILSFGLSLFPAGELRLDRLYGLVTSVFLHGGWIHLFFNAFWTATMGTLVHRVLGTGGFLAVFFGSAVCGGLVQVALNWGVPVIAIGASGGVFGLIGAIGHILVAKPHEPQGQRLRKLVVFSVVMMLLNLAYASVGQMPGTGGAPIAWEAHAGGFFAGLLLFPLLARRRFAR